jgi:hypothetical protein
VAIQFQWYRLTARLHRAPMDASGLKKTRSLLATTASAC